MQLLTVKIGDNSFSSNQVTLAHRALQSPMLVIYLMDVSLDEVKDVFGAVIPETKVEVFDGEVLQGEYAGFRFSNLSFLSLSTKDAGNSYESEVSVTLEKIMEG